MAKLKLIADPTFSAKVAVPRAGLEPVEVLFTFKHRTKTQLDEFIKTRAEKSDLESFLDMVVGWELPDEFNAENVGLILENYIGTALETYRVYIDQLLKAKVKN